MNIEAIFQMREIVNNVIGYLKDFMQAAPMPISFLAGAVFIVLESIFPIIPLAVFIALNILLFGNIAGFLLSWVSTIIGCMVAFALIRSKFKNYFQRKTRKMAQINRIMNRINHMKVPTLVLITAMPFTPAFAVNIAAGLSNIRKSNFLIAIIIAKTSIVYFWGFVGVTFIESFQNPVILLRLALMLLVAYLLSRFVVSKYHLD